MAQEFSDLIHPPENYFGTSWLINRKSVAKNEVRSEKSSDICIIYTHVYQGTTLYNN